MHPRFRRVVPNQPADAADRRRSNYKPVPKNAMRVSKESSEETEEEMNYKEHVSHLLKHSTEHTGVEFADELIKHKMAFGRQAMDHGLETVVSDLSRAMLKSVKRRI